MTERTVKINPLDSINVQAIISGIASSFCGEWVSIGKKLSVDLDQKYRDASKAIESERFYLKQNCAGNMLAMTQMYSKEVIQDALSKVSKKQNGMYLDGAALEVPSGHRAEYVELASREVLSLFEHMLKAGVVPEPLLYANNDGLLITEQSMEPPQGQWAGPYTNSTPQDGGDGGAYGAAPSANVNPMEEVWSNAAGLTELDRMSMNTYMQPVNPQHTGPISRARQVDPGARYPQQQTTLQSVYPAQQQWATPQNLGYNPQHGWDTSYQVAPTPSQGYLPDPDPPYQQTTIMSAVTFNPQASQVAYTQPPSIQQVSAPAASRLAVPTEGSKGTQQTGGSDATVPSLQGSAGSGRRGRGSKASASKPSSTSSRGKVTKSVSRSPNRGRGGRGKK